MNIFLGFGFCLGFDLLCLIIPNFQWYTMFRKILCLFLPVQGSRHSCRFFSRTYISHIYIIRVTVAFDVVQL